MTIALLVPTLTRAQPALNDCSDPYWADTLRCAIFPGAVPQPAPTPPANARTALGQRCSALTPNPLCAGRRLG